MQLAERWASGPVRVCKLCGQELGASGLLSAHLAACHAEVANPADLQQLMEREAAGEGSGHECAICRERVEHSPAALTAHLGQRHSVRLEEYFAQHIGGTYHCRWNIPLYEYD
jgi:hypothetical protein